MKTPKDGDILNDIVMKESKGPNVYVKKTDLPAYSWRDLPSPKASRMQLWLARLFGKKVIHTNEGYRVVAYKWRGKLYLTDAGMLEHIPNAIANAPNADVQDQKVR